VDVPSSPGGVGLGGMGTPWTIISLRRCEGSEPLPGADPNVLLSGATIAGTGAFEYDPCWAASEEGGGTVWKLVPAGCVELVTKSSLRDVEPVSSSTWSFAATRGGRD